MLIKEKPLQIPKNRTYCEPIGILKYCSKKKFNDNIEISDCLNKNILHLTFVLNILCTKTWIVTIYKYTCILLCTTLALNLT